MNLLEGEKLFCTDYFQWEIFKCGVGAYANLIITIWKTSASKCYLNGAYENPSVELYAEVSYVNTYQ